MTGTGREWFLLSKAPTPSPIQLAVQSGRSENTSSRNA